MQPVLVTRTAPEHTILPILDRSQNIRVIARRDGDVLTDRYYAVPPSAVDLNRAFSAL